MFTTERKIEIQLNSAFCMFDFDADVIAWSYRREQQSILRHVEIVIDEPEVIVREHIQLEPMAIDTIASHVFDESMYTPASFDEVLTQVGESVDYSVYSVKELKEIAKSYNYRGYSKMKRAELVELFKSGPRHQVNVTTKMLKDIAKCVNLKNRSKFKTKTELYSALESYLGSDDLSWQISARQ